MILLTSALACATRARTRLFSAACALHWRTFGPKTEITFLLDEDRTECSVECEAVGGPYHCVCTCWEEDLPGVNLAYTDPDVEKNYPEVDPENGMRYRVQVNHERRERVYAEILF